MKIAICTHEAFDSKNQKFQVWKLLDPILLRLDNDKMHHTIEYVKIVLSNDDNYERTVAKPCNEKGIDTLSIVLVHLVGHHPSFFIMNVLGYSGSFQEGVFS